MLLDSYGIDILLELSDTNPLAAIELLIDHGFINTEGYFEYDDE